MLPRNLHLEQINRFHDMLESVDKQLEDETISETEKYALAQQYYRLTKFWSEIDNFIEFKLKDHLDFIIKDEILTKKYLESKQRPDTTTSL